MIGFGEIRLPAYVRYNGVEFEIGTVAVDLVLDDNGVLKIEGE